MYGEIFGRSYLICLQLDWSTFCFYNSDNWRALQWYVICSYKMYTTEVIQGKQGLTWTPTEYNQNCRACYKTRNGNGNGTKRNKWNCVGLYIATLAITTIVFETDGFDSYNASADIAMFVYCYLLRSLAQCSLNQPQLSSLTVFSA